MITNVFSGLQPTGSLHLGNYFGAIRPMTELQNDPTNACRYAVVDLHSLTVEHDPRRLTELTFELAGVLVACGVDPDRSVLFLQSQVAAHAELAYLMEATAAVGEMQRMVQFKEKADQQASARVALLTYPALMAADILAYDTDVVPVGDDQRQHLELARTLAQRFNARYGETFVIPAGAYAQHVARVMDLVDPTRKMGKSSSSLAGVIALLDPPQVVERKIARATTDTIGEVRYAPADQPGVSNLLAILGGLTSAHPAELADAYESYASLKRDVTDAVVEVLGPIQREYAQVRKGGGLDVILRDGADRARQIAGPVVDRARRAMGLAPAA
jgi:tryptophanyl-tRNA synthetase